MVAISKFLYAQSRYYGEVKPENLVLNANLQEFTQRVGYITALASSGKIPVEQAFAQIETLWQQVEKSKQQLGVGDHPFAA
jgi:thioester reductase-like protein